MAFPTVNYEFYYSNLKGYRRNIAFLCKDENKFIKIIIIYLKNNNNNLHLRSILNLNENIY